MYDALSYHRKDQVDFIEKFLIFKGPSFSKKLLNAVVLQVVSQI
jgi:hypothetical protein